MMDPHLDAGIAGVAEDAQGLFQGVVLERDRASPHWPPFRAPAAGETPTLAAASSICRQVLSSIGIPCRKRFSRVSQSGSPGRKTSSKPGASAADLMWVLSSCTISPN